MTQDEIGVFLKVGEDWHKVSTEKDKSNIKWKYLSLRKRLME